MSKADKKVLVIDHSVTELVPERIHQIPVDGEIVEVKFNHDVDTVLPFGLGVKFLKDGFTVKELDGTEELRLPPVPSDSIAQQLASDECVAKYSELTLEALKLRAAQKAGGEIYLDADEDERDNMISLLSGELPVLDDIVIDESFDGLDVDPEAEEIEDPADDTAPDIVDPQGAEVTDPVVDPEAEPDPVIDGVMADVDEPVEDPVADTESNVIPEGNTETAPKSAPEAETVTDPEAPAEVATDPVAAEEFTLAEVEKATDEALRLAAENNVDINNVTGTGEDGNILVSDVQTYLDNLTPEAPAE